MVYKEIELSKVLPNPYQTRKHIDEDKIDQLAGTIDDKLGIRNAPLIRPHPTRSGFYEIGSGWRRMLAARKKGIQSAVLRVEDLTDSEMKTEVLVENAARVDLDDDELFQALEQIREDKGIEKGAYHELARVSGVEPTKIMRFYEAKEFLPKLKESARIDLEKSEYKPHVIISEAAGLPESEKIKLVEKAAKEEWGPKKVRDVKKSLQQMESETRKEILKPETHLNPEAIKKVSELPLGSQKAVVVEARVRRLNEDDTLKMVERVREGKQPQVDRTIDEAKETLEGFSETLLHVKTWGVNQYGILGPAKWGQACELFSRMEDHLRWLRTRGWEGNA